MRKLLYRRLMLSLPLLFGVSVLTFVLAGLTPGSAARAILGTTATNQSIAALNRSLGLNKPIYQQYWHWLYGILHGQLGHSIFTGEPVSRILASGLPITLTLIGASVLLSLLIGVPLGVLSAQRSGGRGQLLDGLSMVGFAVPTFWLGLVLVLVFANWLHVLPATGWVYPSASLTGWLRSLALPVLTLSLGGSSVIAKQTRDGMLEALESEFIRSLRSRGIPEYSITYRHALRNALPNVVTLVGLYVVSLLLGTTLVESVFALQGLGSIAVQATEQHDLPIVEGAALYFTVIVIVAFALVDLVRAWLNPKLRTAN